jgi:hypothetical protein
MLRTYASRLFDSTFAVLVALSFVVSIVYNVVA